MATLISWTNETWNPTTGCSHVDDDCRNCYAEALSLRYRRSAFPWTGNHAADNIKLHYDRLDKPRRFKPNTRCFVNSMSDLFHPLVPDDFVLRVFRVMEETPWVTFQILTKRPARAAAWPGPWTPNIWMGTSIGHPRALSRMEELRSCPAAIRFISFEPLHQRIGAEIDLSGYHWVIVGGESGPNFRPMNHSWAREIRDACVAQRVAFFFKQDSAFRTETRPWLVEADGSCWEWRQYPNDFRPPKLVSAQRARNAQGPRQQHLAIIP